MVNEDNLAELTKAVEAIVDHSRAAARRGLMPAAKPVMVDTTTDTDLTPHWWMASGDNVVDMPLADLDRPRDPIKPGRTAPSVPTPTRATKTYASAVGGGVSSDSSNDNMEAEFTVVRKKSLRKTQPGPAPRTDRPKPRKPPAVLIKVADGETFEGTLKSVQKAVDPVKLGVDVKKISKTLDGHLLVEMSGGVNAASGAATLSRAVRDSAGDLAGRVVQLGTMLEVEIVDLDPCAQRDDVMAALEAAVELHIPSNAEALKTQVEFTGLWQLKSGSKATAKIHQTAAKISSIRVGWTSAKVRPRKPEPQRCFRCHGFGHTCTGLDLPGKCRRCGGSGHL